MNRWSAVAGLALAEGFLIVSSSLAHSGTSGDGQQAATNELKALHDPTILANRVWLDSEWNKFRDGSQTLDETLIGFRAWRISDRQDWAVRINVPFTMSSAADDPGGSDQQALGDIKLATGTAFRLNEKWRAGGGIELRTPSGTNDALSANTWRLKEIGAVAWDVNSWLTLSPSLEHSHSIAEQGDTAPEHFLELYFPATILLPDRWAITARYKAKIDFRNDNARTHEAKLQVAKHLKSIPAGFSLSIKKPLDDDSNKDFQINFLTTYYFPSR
jgi:hypothetical protein